MMLAYRYRLAAPAAYITEAHPKALLKAINLSAVDWQSICHRLNLSGPPPADENERDAVLAAVAAREGSAGRWMHNLAADRDASELDPAHYWVAPVNYAWFE
ncbi:hypothetical protein [Elioraea tepidiphila]|jgi:hypothetical protein|uniref:hypothetical protein n=1 Tax=Elioraea tepidiphila TaxID=457934 RepID=UPI002FD9049A